MLYLLEKIAYTSRPEENYESKITQSIVKTIPTFPYNPDSKTSHKTAEKWAKYYTEEAFTPSVLVQDNKPFSVKVIGLDFRSEGGRAYKVVDEQGRLFDLREDQFVEVLTHSGIESGGQIKGQFIWGQNHSSVRLVYVGGEQHQEMIKGLQERKENLLNKKSKERPKGITKSQLEIGGVYHRKVYGNKEIVLYLGEFYVKNNPNEIFCMLKNINPRTRWLKNSNEVCGIEKYITTTWEEEVLNEENTSFEAQKNFNPFIKKIGQCSPDDLKKARTLNVGLGLSQSYNFIKKYNELSEKYEIINPRPIKSHHWDYLSQHHYENIQKWKEKLLKWIEQQIVWKN